jgi:hypothetical protein
MPQFLGSILGQVNPAAIIDIGITALLIYWLFKLIRGTRAVRLVIGVSVLVIFYGLAVAFDLRLLTQIMQAGAVVGVDDPDVLPPQLISRIGGVACPEVREALAWGPTDDNIDRWHAGGRKSLNLAPEHVCRPKVGRVGSRFGELFLKFSINLGHRH